MPYPGAVDDFGKCCAFEPACAVAEAPVEAGGMVIYHAAETSPADLKRPAPGAE